MPEAPSRARYQSRSFGPVLYFLTSIRYGMPFRRKYASTFTQNGLRLGNPKRRDTRAARARGPLTARTRANTVEASAGKSTS